MITYELEGMILLGRNIDNKVYIPRLSLTYSDPRISFKFRQTQFPLVILFAMTINKSTKKQHKRLVTQFGETTPTSGGHSTQERKFTTSN